ncbi:MAG: hypothetical protein OEZ06_12315 [Myxococcales bacterium]|nr:hypothetical protein [Myxococcales bacterium]
MSPPDSLSRHVQALQACSGSTRDDSITARRIAATLLLRRRRRHLLQSAFASVMLVLSVGTTAYAMVFGAPPVLQRLLAAAFADEPPPVAARSESLMQPPAAPGSIEARGNEGTEAVQPVFGVDGAGSGSPGRDEGAEVRPTSAAAVVGSRGRSVQTAPASPATPPGAAEAVSEAPAAASETRSRRLYAVAHRAHFVLRDWGVALEAWNAYLEQVPDGVLRLEAEYNRALCLVRLRRNAEATASLRPFADGNHGRYRRREASALLRALSESARR